MFIWNLTAFQLYRDVQLITGGERPQGTSVHYFRHRVHPGRTTDLPQAHLNTLKGEMTGFFIAFFLNILFKTMPTYKRLQKLLLTDHISEKYGLTKANFDKTGPV